MRALVTFWRGEGGAGQALRIATPLILSSATFTIMHIVDRRFLAAYSLDAMAASSVGGVMSFAALSLFMGTATYVNTFVAQYSGAGRPERVGASLWQGVYFALISAVLMAPLYFLADALFRLAGHGEPMASLEADYFRVLVLGGGFVVFNMAVSSFFSGRGHTIVVMWVRVAALALNVPLDYCLIFGRFGFPEWGIFGAAVATVASTAFASLLFALLTISPRNRREFGTLSQWRWDRDLFGRLLRYGLPSGVQFLIDIVGFSIFLVMIGRLGALELKATSATWALNMLVFMPMIGFAIAVSTMVGQAIGRERIETAERATWTIFLMVSAYMSLTAFAMVVFPRPFLALVLGEASGREAPEVWELATLLLRFVAFYSLFDAVAMVYSSAIKGAGDTRFVMWAMAVLSLALLVIPSYLICTVWRLSVHFAWGAASAYIVAISIVFYLRYRLGPWRSMRVIEPSLPRRPVEAPTVEV